MSTIPLTDAKTHLARLLHETEELGEHFVITRSGRPAGVLLPVEEYEGLLETLDILADPKMTGAIREGLAEIARGEIVEHDELWAELDADK